MSKLFMLAGAITADADPQASAYVVLTEGTKSRLFKITGRTSAPKVEERGAGTTFDIKRFNDETARDLEGLGPIKPVVDPSWACEAVRIFLRADLGI